MKKFSELQSAIKHKSIVLFFCECNPPTINHLVAFTAAKQIAESQNADYAILLSNGRGQKAGPLSVTEKLEYTNMFFPGFNIVVASESMNTPVDVARVYNKNYKNLIEICGTDGIAAYEHLHEQHNNRSYIFNKVNIVSIGEISPDNSQSSIKLKRAIAEGNLINIQKELLPHVREIDARRFMNDARRGMGLDIIKESIKFGTSEIREKYIAGEIFHEDTFVESNLQLFKIINRNSNYITVSDSVGILSKKWLNDVQPIEVSEETRIKFEGITEMKFSSADKIKVGKIIGGMLGADVSKGSNAEQMVNSGLRITRSKTLNAEAISILQKMLKTAADAGILYDQKLVPKLVVDKKTGEEYDPQQKFDDMLNHPDTKAQFKRMKDEQGKGWPERNEDVECSADSKIIMDPNTEKGYRKVRTKRLVFDPKKVIAPEETIGGRTTESEEISEHIVKTDKGYRLLSHKGKNLGDFDTQEASEKHEREVKYFKHKNESIEEALKVGDKVKGDYPGDKEKNLHITYIHSSGKVKLADHNGVAQPNYRNPENLEKIHEDFESIDEAWEMSPEEQENHISDIKAQTEKAHLKGQRHQTLYTKDQIIADQHHLHLNSLGGKQVSLPIGTSLGATSNTNRVMKIKHTRNEEVNDTDEFESNAPDEDISDEEIDDMIKDIDDWDDIVDTYDSSELSYIDADTGEHIADVADRFDGGEGDPEEATVDDELVVTDAAYTGEKLPTRKVAESIELNEVMSRLERIKAGMRFHRTATKRERAVKIALKRHSSVQKLGHRARALAIKTMKMKIAKKPLNTLSVPEKERIERIIQRRKNVIDRIAIRLMPRVRKIEQTRLAHSTFTKPAA